MIITTIVTAAAASLASPSDVAKNIDSLTGKQEQRSITTTCGAELEDKTKTGVSVNYTYSYVSGRNQVMDDSRTWD